MIASRYLETGGWRPGSRETRCKRATLALELRCLDLTPANDRGAELVTRGQQVERGRSRRIESERVVD